MNQQPPQWQNDPHQPGTFPNHFTPPAGSYGNQGNQPYVQPQAPISSARQAQLWFKRQRTSAKVVMGCGTIFLAMMLCLCSAVIAAPSTGRGGTQTSQATVTGSTNNVAFVTVTPAAKSASKIPVKVPTKAVPTVIPTPKPTPSPTPRPTPIPTPIPTPRPTPPPPAPTPPPPAPTPTPRPTQPPVNTGVNGNPWGYNFNGGSLIYSPPGSFCSYFACINNFWNGLGYVVECNDGMYSKSGGRRGACSYHGGELQPLYAP